MKMIVFSDYADETFNVMVEDDRFVVCSRVYTVDENDIARNKWQEDLDMALLDGLCENDFIYDNGERPIEYDEDTQCYTLVDKAEKIRGSDNFYNKFDYLDMSECEDALSELNSGEMEISRRNRVVLSSFTITDCVVMK